jgi:fructokinase
MWAEGSIALKRRLGDRPHAANLVRCIGSNLIFRNRRPREEDRTMSARFRIGIDLGGTKIEGAAIDVSGSVRVRRRVATPVQDYRATIEAIIALIEDIEQEISETASVGIGIPGAVSLHTGLIKNANSTWLIGRPLQRDIETALGRPTRLANDANCFALSEATDGAGAGTDTVFGVILGTGVGGGIAVRGQLLVGANAIAGEWGHNPLPWPTSDEIPGPACYCGRSGCIESFLSGPGFAADHYRHCGARLGAPQIAHAAAAGDPDCGATLARYTNRLARGLALVINLIDPGVIVLGGGLSGISTLYDQVPRFWTRYVFSDRVVTRLLPPVHGDSSGVRGAAWLWSAREAP